VTERIFSSFTDPDAGPARIGEDRSCDCPDRPGHHVRPADDIDDYRADPRGAYCSLPGALAFCASPALWGFAMWGRPAPTDVERILPLIALEIGPSVEPHASLVDLRHIEAANPGSFHVLCRFLQDNVEAMGRQLTRAAVVRPPGFPGMIVAGFHEVVGGRYPVRVFSELAPAAEWVEGGQHLAVELEEAIESASRSSLAVVNLRRWLDDNLAVATLERAAHAIGRGARSLQRDLSGAGSSFQQELSAARIRRAKRLLARTDSSVTEIAGDIGCASPQHFSVLFRRRTGMSPSAWRAHHRAR